jgi:hypothetical protein
MHQLLEQVEDCRKVLTRPHLATSSDRKAVSRWSPESPWTLMPAYRYWETPTSKSRTFATFTGCAFERGTPCSGPCFCRTAEKNGLISEFTGSWFPPIGGMFTRWIPW